MIRASQQRGQVSPAIAGEHRQDDTHLAWLGLLLHYLTLRQAPTEYLYYEASQAGHLSGWAG